MTTTKEQKGESKCRQNAINVGTRIATVNVVGGNTMLDKDGVIERGKLAESLTRHLKKSKTIAAEAILDWHGERVAGLTAERDAYKAVLESLTPGGSEFVNDPEYCRDYVQRKLNSNHESIKRAVKESRALEAQVAEMKELLDAAEHIELDEPFGAEMYQEAKGRWTVKDQFHYLCDEGRVKEFASPLEAFKAVKENT